VLAVLALIIFIAVRSRLRFEETRYKIAIGVLLAISVLFWRTR
jgi:hypothetical protein